MKKGRKFGHVVTKETRKKISEANFKRFSLFGHPMMGKHHSKETKEKMRLLKLGRKLTKEHKEKIRLKSLGNKSNTGRKLSKETKLKISLANIGDKAHAWRGGISFEPYPVAWNRQLKRNIRDRDKNICFVCKIFKLNLDVHHIDYDKNNCKEFNLISLCRKCHMKTNHKRNYWINYFKGIIKSS